MATKPYRIVEGSLTERFHQSRAKIQAFAGGFANGKTSGLCIKAITIGRDYPGAAILLGRSTFPKLNDTLRREFFKWFPAKWKKSFDKKENTLEWTNGTTVFFRYVAQQGKQEEQTTSNLLSASYDFIGLDQVDDPEIEYKDFLDLMGRLRGTTPYIGNDPTMPLDGPRMMVLTANPTRNWFYRKIIKPYHLWKNQGIVSEGLLINEDSKQPMLEVFEGSTYENADNLAKDYIRGLELTYHGQMRERFLLGQWGAFEGLVYPMFDLGVHVLPHNAVLRHLQREVANGVRLTVIEGYDHGLVVPSCYLIGFVDSAGRIIVIDGYYKANSTVEQTAKAIASLRETYSMLGLKFKNAIYADPDVFRRKSGSSKTLGVTVANMFIDDYGIEMTRGNNDIMNGVAKVQAYLSPQGLTTHPVTGNYDSPLLYFSEKCDFVMNEITDFYWKRNTQGDYEDTPQERNDHSLDTIRYMITDRPVPSPIMIPEETDPLAAVMRWNERERPTRLLGPRRHVA